MPNQNPYDEEERKRRRAPAPTNFTNFARYFNANKDVAEREATGYSNRAQNAVDAAGNSLKQSQQTFNQNVAKGTVQAVPNANVGQAAAPPSNTNTGSTSGALVGEATRVGAGGGLTSAEMQALADQRYSGPGGLDDTEGIEGTYANTLAAQQNLNALGSQGGVQALIQQQNQAGNAGTSGFSAGLVGTAGRKSFDALRARFNPEKDLKTAGEEAALAAEKAGADSAKNADEWAKLAGIEATAEASQKAQDDAVAAGKAARDADAAKEAKFRLPPPGKESNVMWGVDPKDKKAMAERQAELAKFREATAKGPADDLKEFVNVTSPSEGIANALGERNPLGDYFTQTFHPNSGNASGSTHGDHIPWRNDSPGDFWLWRSMTPDMWAELNRKPHAQQRVWMNIKIGEMRNAQTAKETAAKNSRSS